MDINDLSKLTLPDDESGERLLRLIGQYRDEAIKCSQSSAYFAACVMLGARLEALLLAMVDLYPDQAFQSEAAKRSMKRRSNRPLTEWSLGELLAVARELAWLPSTDGDWSTLDGDKLQIGDHATNLSYFRNLIHPGNYIDLGYDLTPEARDYEHLYEVLETVGERLAELIRQARDNGFGIADALSMDC